MQLTKLARTSLTILVVNRARTLVSCVAIAGGVAALVLMAGAGQAAERDITARIHEMGSSVLTVRAGAFVRFGRHVQQMSRTSSLVYRDAELLRKGLPSTLVLSGVATVTKPVRWQRHSRDVSIAGVDPPYFGIQRLKSARGRFFSAPEARGMLRMAVLGAAIARDLFELDDPIGKRVRIGGVPFEIVGVAAEKGVGLAGVVPDKTVYVPLAALRARLLGSDRLDSILVQSEGPTKLARVWVEMREVLRRAHRLPNGRPDDFTIQDPAVLLATEHSMGESFRTISGGVAAITLATGGIGIVAVMLMAVRERTREIGLRRAVGATRAAVLVQFLLEGAVLASLGGLGGAALALPANAMICSLAGWPVVWPYATALEAFVCSGVLGLVCGVVPAMRAARLEPASAVRAAA